MKFHLVAFLIKSDYNLESIIDRSKSGRKVDIDIANTKAVLYIKSSSTKPRWASLFDGQEGVDDSWLRSKSVKGLFVIEVRGRILAFTFGHGRSMLFPYVIERGFGLRITLNLGDPEQIKSIDKSTLDRIALKTRSQTSQNTTVDNFDFEFDHEILKSMCALVDRSDEELEVVSGCDSVSLYTEVSLNEIPSIAKRLLDAYESKIYQDRYPWVDFVQLVSDPIIINKLNSDLLCKINNKHYDEVWISAPEIVNYDDFSGFVFKKSSKYEPCFHTELDLEIYASETKLRYPVKIDSLKRKKIHCFNADEREIGSWSLYQCLNGEANLDGSTYIINDSKWYKIDDDFSITVNDFFEQLPRSDMKFAPYGDMKEGEYLRYIEDGENFALLDQKWIYPHGSKGHRIEFCDLMSQCGALIHVKKYGSSSVLSHLFAQATVATELLMNDESIKAQVNAYLEDTYLTLNFDPKESPRKYRIVLAIMHNKAGPIHMPFFSKVNLRHHARRLINMGFKVELAKIDS